MIVSVIEPRPIVGWQSSRRKRVAGACWSRPKAARASRSPSAARAPRGRLSDSALFQSSRDSDEPGTGKSRRRSSIVVGIVGARRPRSAPVTSSSRSVRQTTYLAWLPWKTRRGSRRSPTHRGPAQGGCDQRDRHRDLAGVHGQRQAHDGSRQARLLGVPTRGRQARSGPQPVAHALYDVRDAAEAGTFTTGGARSSNAARSSSRARSNAGSNLATRESRLPPRRLELNAGDAAGASGRTRNTGA